MPTNGLFWLMVTIVALLALGSISTFIAGIAITSNCKDRCEKGKKILIMSTILFIVAGVALNYGICSSCDRHLTVIASVLFILAATLFGVGLNMNVSCVDKCKTATNLLIASNSLAIATGFMVVIMQTPR